MTNVLIIDDDSAVVRLLTEVVNKMGHTAHCADSGKKGLQSIQSMQFDVVLLDVGLPDGNGLQILPRIRELLNAPEVIIITGNGDPEAAELAVKNGAWDYLVKPSSLQNMMLTIQRALAYRFQKLANSSGQFLKRNDIVGKSPVLNAALERVAQAAAVDSNVLICGETGTGKELLARTIHENSPRAKNRFIIVDCAALPQSLVESILFGHTKGAFTGAEKEREGLIRQAHGGTLFLDEVGELPLSAQKTFLRVIQERTLRPVSSRQEIHVNFRLIAATNRDLHAMAAKGTFRSDLLYRLGALNFEAPPLRRRPEDIKRLAVYHINKISEIYGYEVKGVSGELYQALQQYHWPGNVRELYNALEESMAIAGNEPTLYPHHLPTRIRAVLTRLAVKACVHACDQGTSHESGTEKPDMLLPINKYRQIMERRYLERLNNLTNGNRKKACLISGLSRTRLFELLKKYDLSLPQEKSNERNEASTSVSPS